MEKTFSFINEHRFVCVCSSFLVGVFLSSVAPLPLAWGFFVILLGIICTGYAYTFRFFAGKSAVVIIGLSLIVSALGIIRVGVHKNISENADFAERVGSQITFISVVLDEPQNKETYEQYLVRVPESGEKILVKASVYPSFAYGDEVKWSGKLLVPKNFQTDGGKEFDYVAYLEKDHIRYILSFAHGELVSRGNGNVVVALLFRIKRAFVRNIETLIPEPASSLLSGVLLGIQDSLGKDLEEIFRRVGIIHIVVLSGYNITVVAESLIGIFSFLRRRVALSIGAIGIVLFSLMVGATPSVLRASAMALLVLLSKFTGRTYAVGRALLLAACAMVLWNPSVLVFDTSFQLSFLSTIAIIWISPLVKQGLAKVPEKFGLREVVSATLATQIFVLPLLLYKMGQVSLVALPVNVLVLGFIPPIMLLGFIAGLFQFVLHIVAFPFAFLAYLLLMYVIQVATFSSTLPFASITISYFPAPFLWVSYAVFGFVYYKFRHQQKNTQPV